MPDPLEERVVASELIHRGRYLEFRVDTIERADGSRGTRDVVGHPGAIAVLALDDDDRLLMVRQWRVPAGRGLLEIPAGTLEVRDGVTEDPDGAARRELEEETGHRASAWRRLASFWTAPGFASELMHLYLATEIAGVGGADDRLAPDEDERLELRHVPLDEAIAMVEDGSIVDAKSILGILWLDRLRRSGDRAAPPPLPPSPGGHEIRYGFSATQFAIANAAYARSSRSTVVFGSLLILLGLINVPLGAPSWIWLPCVLGGIAVVTGLVAVPFALLLARGRRPVLRDLRLQFDDAGIHTNWVAGGSDISWSGIEKITRTSSYLFLKFIPGSGMMVPEGAFTPGQLDAFARIALRHGLTMDGHRVDVAAR